MTNFQLPSPLFAWACFILLMSGLCISSYIDFRTYRIPKIIPGLLLIGGLLASLGRGAILAWQGKTVWLMSHPGPLMGAMDAWLLALVSGFMAFSVFLVLWILGVCGGGDVKLFTALATWIDPYDALLIMAVSFSLVCVWSLSVYIFRIAQVQPGPTRIRRIGHGGDQITLKGTRTSYSMPLTLATAIVLLIKWHLVLS